MPNNFSIKKKFRKNNSENAWFQNVWLLLYGSLWTVVSCENHLHFLKRSTHRCRLTCSTQQNTHDALMLSGVTPQHQLSVTSILDSVWLNNILHTDWSFQLIHSREETAARTPLQICAQWECICHHKWC